ncbi:PilW family protein [Mycetocola zhujimingii]|uniref:PilW family protein n=1 Tax=Mycetocola zhujimingii TaxID=2079792 RepID=UPI000D3A8E36|nr:prepilin-type N-terminal cleavage/methylation domain-containing protein [Mycetocola zhujimingii]AWB87230.1 hypothetical protein C3E77_11780 [Mycetocola zhujimingii]
MTSRKRVAVLAARAAAERDRGISLIELIIAMVLLSIVTTVVAALLISLTNAATMSRGIDASSKTASNAMNDLALVIRNGSTVPVKNNIIPLAAFVAGGPESLTIHSILGGSGLSLSPVKVKFTVNAKRQLIEQRWTAKVTDGYFSWPADAAMTSRNLSGSLLIPKDEERPLFTYLDEKRNPIEMSAGNQLSAPNLGKVRSVLITMRVEAEGGAKGQIIELENIVGVPNLGEVSAE